MKKKIRRDASFIFSDLQNFIKTTTSRLSGQSRKVGKLTRLQKKEKGKQQGLDYLNTDCTWCMIEDGQELDLYPLL